MRLIEVEGLPSLPLLLIVGEPGTTSVGEQLGHHQTNTMTRTINQLKSLTLLVRSNGLITANEEKLFVLLITSFCKKFFKRRKSNGKE
jgi:hypothetical protein